jgi:uncharacterized protein YecE (DUF72 family)
VPTPDLPSSADWGYVRLRREDYSDKELEEWIEKLKSQAWDETYVFFKHEETASGPKYASRFLELASQGSRRKS